MNQRSLPPFLSLSETSQPPPAPSPHGAGGPSRRVLIAAVAAGTLLLASLAASLYLFLDRPKIAFVRSQDLVYGYAGMKEAQSKYQAKMQAWQVNLDSLQSQYRAMVTEYDASSANLSETERSMRRQALAAKQEELQRSSQAQATEAEEEDERITQGVLNQINSFMMDYGRRHHYDYILGTTLSGNILYGKNSRDITDEALVELNTFYLGAESRDDAR